MPTLSQIQYYIKYRREKNGETNSMVGLIERLLENETASVTPECPDLLFFGYNKDENGNIKLGDGSDEEHFHLGITSHRLLKKLRRSRIYYIDCTYKIIKYGYPQLIFGITDIRRKFHPIAYMITSHETQLDFQFFFSTFQKLVEDQQLKFEPDFIVQDACMAMRNSIESLYPDCVSIMCFFHVKLNVIILVYI
jgi:hypothetical protein